MKKFYASIHINAPKEKVWDIMLDPTTYRQWASAFSEGSFYQGSWDKGSKILFLGPDPERNGSGGMSSYVVENRPYEFISVEHTAIVYNDIEDSVSDEAKKWVPSHENYTFSEEEGGTKLQVEIDLLEENIPVFEKMWSAALERLKDMVEKA